MDPLGQGTANVEQAPVGDAVGEDPEGVPGDLDPGVQDPDERGLGEGALLEDLHERGGHRDAEIGRGSAVGPGRIEDEAVGSGAPGVRHRRPAGGEEGEALHVGEAGQLRDPQGVGVAASEETAAGSAPGPRRGGEQPALGEDDVGSRQGARFGPGLDHGQEGAFGRVRLLFEGHVSSVRRVVVTGQQA
ncbi:hypothetical protein ACIOGZ_29865 [Kitasatospora sp. NPDC088160]|uniref:hypothetical protein n=1 Tax=Kitasatospora sp. NPDC088160 TaxID=3364072 RepID=UPI00382A283C